MSTKAKESLDLMLGNETKPRSVKSGAVILRGAGARYHTLVNQTGEKTPIGAYYEQKTYLILHRQPIGRGTQNI